MDGANALPHRNHAVPADPQADGCLGEVAAVRTAFDHDAVALQREGRHVGAGLAADQELEGGVGDLEGVAAVLQFLEPVQDASAEVVAVAVAVTLAVAGQVEAQLTRLGNDVGAAGQLADQHAGAVTANRSALPQRSP